MSNPGWLRLLLEIQYDGTRFQGWQIQPEARTVQGELAAVIQRLSPQASPITGAGRTDRGVHATGQVASVTLPSPRWSPLRFQGALNALLPRDIWVSRSVEVPRSFHPRHDAVARSYEYRIGTGTDARSPFAAPWCWALGQTPAPSRLQEAAALLPGTRSFRAFARSGQPERGEICTVHSAEWRPWIGPWGVQGVAFHITANRFLHHMVRYLVGTMVEVGLGKRPLQEFRMLLEGGGHDLVTSPPAPPQGLYLTRVDYPPHVLEESKATVE